MAAVAEELNTINLYPDIAAEDLRDGLAQHWSVGPENIAVGAGSVEVASQLIHAVTDPGDMVMFAWRSFEAYPLLTTVAGAVPQPIPLAPDGGHDLEAMAAAVTSRTRLIFICNPNNPSGVVLDSRAVEDFLQKVPSDVLVVLDEAYVHFNHSPTTAIGIDLFRQYPNVAVLHTFSKAYGLAGLRVGYAIAAPALIETLQKTAVPFAVSALAQRAAIESLRSEPDLQKRVEVIVAERRRVTAALLATGLPVLTSEANFVWIDSRGLTGPLAELFDEHALAVRVFPGEGIRVTIGSREANDRLLEAAKQAARLFIPLSDARN